MTLSSILKAYILQEHSLDEWIFSDQQTYLFFQKQFKKPAEPTQKTVHPQPLPIKLDSPPPPQKAVKAEVSKPELKPAVEEVEVKPKIKRDYADIRKLVAEKFPDITLIDTPKIQGECLLEMIVVYSSCRTKEENQFLSHLREALKILFGKETQMVSKGSAIQIQNKTIPLETLDCYLKEPKLKRELWQTLKSLQASCLKQP